MNPSYEMSSRASGIERLSRMLDEGVRVGLADTLDIRLVAVEEGRVEVESTPGTHLYNPNGVVHGGFTATMLDFACGYVTLSRLPAGSTFTTLELKVSYHRPITADTGRLRAVGEIVTMGRRAAFAEARLVDRDGRLYASATSSLLLTHPEG